MTRRPLAGLLAAEAVSLTGSHIAAVAVPWLVLVTTGSATRVGVVALAQTLPFVLAGVLGGALVDRVGPRRVAVTADVASAIAVGLIPFLHGLGQLTFARLLTAVALAGAIGGCGNVAKRALLPAAIEASRTPMARATALFESFARAALLVGLPVGGVLVTALGPALVLALDAASFALSALAVATLVRVRAPARNEQTGLSAGFRFLRRDRLVVAVTAMLFVTNLVDQAFMVVFLPVWVRDTGAGPAALGWIGGVFGLGAVLGAVAYASLAVRLPRVTTFAICCLIAGSPKLFTLALTDHPGLVLAVAFGAGLAASTLNPILMAVGYERIPVHLRGRVLGAVGAVSFAGVPAGGLLGGLAVDLGGLRHALLTAGAIYLVVTLAPFLTLSRLREAVGQPAPKSDSRQPPSSPPVPAITA
ncbi:putative drug antiporter protein precursor [Paractinoplanes abujensis]|uniref:MFS family permease n=1 Tax=Paractinoplanes abujensis TaxID=882441 RepID=A0A7W7G6L1_9ACTN|nr:MFS transporter [Actinoplanes abujensis]MBB4697525.1 MFS family permease [Actinoplanes abujensis]GID19984.1 putative drug antiporter protein precursor [Actinoplanes abujensis]